MTAHYRLPSGPVPASASHVLPRAPSTASGLYRRGIKRALDTVAVLLSLPVVLPVVLLLALVVMRDGAAPFYRQTRVGRDGRLYTMWKLRSMVKDADARLETHLASDNAARGEWDTTQKLKADPRITPFGRFLRKSSLRPGITGLWQVSERNATAFADRAHYDTRYEQSLSLVTDLRILMATIRVVLRGTGY